MMLVMPERTVWRIADKDVLKTWADERTIGRRLMENLSQLLGFDIIGSSGSRAGHGRENYFLLHEATWMYHEAQSDVVPLFGSGPNKFKQLKASTSVPVAFQAEDLPEHAAEAWVTITGWLVGW